jgi:hypothetical protein
MKGLFFLVLTVCLVGFSSAQENSNKKEEPIFNYLDLKEEFDLLVDVSIVNPECATKKINYYSLIIGTTIIDKKIERISVLVPCLSNQFVQTDLITIKPIKTPKSDISYMSIQQNENGQIIDKIYGSEFRAIWGNVVKVL